MNLPRFNLISTLAKECSDIEIARRLKISRSTVQRYRWLSQLPKYVRDAFLNGQFADRYVFGLWQHRHNRKRLRAEFKKTPQRQFYRKPMRTVGEIRHALESMDLDKRTLLWVLRAR